MSTLFVNHQQNQSACRYFEGLELYVTFYSKNFIDFNKHFIERKKICKKHPEKNNPNVNFGCLQAELYTKVIIKKKPQFNSRN